MVVTLYTKRFKNVVNQYPAKKQKHESNTGSPARNSRGIVFNLKNELQRIRRKKIEIDD